jgi:outer membrane biosynthesis protein TonB
MSRKIFPHEKLMEDNNIVVSKLDADTASFISDFKQTMKGVNMLAQKTGEFKMKPETESKLRRLDKVICNGIFAYMEDEDDNNPPTPPTPPSNEPPAPTPPANNPTPPVNEPAPIVPPINEPPTPPVKKKQGFVMGMGFIDEE